MNDIIQMSRNELLLDICGAFKNRTNIKKNYIEYISALLYIRYIKKLRNDVSVSFETIYQERKNYYIANIIDIELQKLREEIQNKDLFSNISFRNVSVYREIGEESVLGLVIEGIYSLEKSIANFENNGSSILSKAYEYVLEKTVMQNDIIADKKEFYTPSYITNMMSNMIVTDDTDTVFDPSCGSGNFLLSANQQKNKINVNGIENNINIYNICMTNLLLHGIDNRNIYYQERVKTNNYSYDTILMNPPFSQKNWIDKMNDDDLRMIEKNGLTKNAVADYAYVLAMLNHLNTNGKMATILPHGVLFRENEIEVRKNLVRNNYIEAIVGLPEGLFYSNRISVIIMILSKKKKDDKILFIDASKDYISERKNNIISESMQKRLIDIYTKREEITGYSHLASIKEIENNFFNLTIKRYIKEENIIPKVEIKKNVIMSELEDLEREKEILEENINDVLEILGIKEIFEKTKEDTQTKVNHNIYDIDYERIGENIKEARRKREITQEQLAEKMNLSVAFLSRIERGVSHINLQRLADVCKILDVSIGDILS